MSFYAFFLATRWGRREGGLNVFNKGLAEGTAEVLKVAGRCYCIVEDAPAPSEADSVNLLAYEDRQSAERTADQICRVLTDAGETDAEMEVALIGHDIHTGQLAIDCARLVSKRFKNCRSAVVRHMHYRHYANEKGTPTADLERKAKAQEEVTRGADLVFAVGPLLTETVRGVRSPELNVTTLIPGAPQNRLKNTNLELGWQVFLSGRLEAADDRIKNATLAIEGLREAYQRIASVSGPGATAMGSRGTIRLLGADPETAAFDSLRARTGQYFSIIAEPYADDEAAILEPLGNSHFAMMPSWHEGFGLTGWEAVCTGVPLICSRHSGLYQFLERSVWGVCPEVQKESVFPLDLVGRSPGGDSRPEDIQSTAKAILDWQRTDDRARLAARGLAEHLQNRYTWAGCAKTLVDALGWPLPSSVDWQDRQEAAARRESFVQPDDIADDDLIKAAVTIVEEGRAFVEWQTVCTALNLLSSRGKVWRGTQGMAAIRDTKVIATGIEITLANGRSTHTPLRLSGALDLVWRLLGAASSVVTTLAEFNSLVGPRLWTMIADDGFLTREFFYYSCRFCRDFVADGDELLHRIQSLNASGGGEESHQIRLGRLAGKHPELRALLDESGVLAEMPLAAATAVRITGLAGGEGGGGLKPENAADALWLMSETILSDANGPRMTLDYVRELHGDGAIPRRWRGDRRFEAAALLASQPAGSLLDSLDRLARDEDESLRWACLDMCFSGALRKRMISGPAQMAPEALRRKLGEIIDTAVAADGGHPWLQREFLKLYLAESDLPKREPARFTLEDFPVSRRLLGPSVHEMELAGAQQYHPEVMAARADALRRIKRILLILPPIQAPGEEGSKPASRTTTPALGLGLIASALADAGHDVQLVDCHRFPDQINGVIDHASSFDWVGLSVVLSTVRSAYQLIGQIRNKTQKPLIGVGGPAVNLQAWRGGGRPSEQFCWDFEVRGDGERLLAELVSLTDVEGAWPEIAGVAANMDSPHLTGRCAHWTYSSVPDAGERTGGWSPPVLIDRRVFRGVRGSYEPAATRRQSTGDMEAHVVMSRGCDWNCTFCTERVTLSGGERRREAASVLEELRQLCRVHPMIHIQFIDDNLLPQIAAAKTDAVIQARSVTWAEQFIEGLAALGAETESVIRWRGIFRIEDFLLYEERIPSFVERLRRSGCQMLAFGVEHGNEAKRQKLKLSVGTSNAAITALFSRLRASGIDTKGYFILGGHKESEALGLETIDFAISSGVTLAYFALFKDFVTASNLLKRNAVTASQTADKYLTYDQLWLDLDERLSQDEARPDEVSRSTFPDLTERQRKIYHQLHKLGFRFADLVKYNDYHSDDGSSGPLAQDLYYNDAQLYADVVRHAYAAFYLRPTFVRDYKRLLAGGY